MMNRKMFFAVALLVSMSALRASEGADASQPSRLQRCSAFLNANKHTIGGTFLGAAAIVGAEGGSLPVSSRTLFAGTAGFLAVSAVAHKKTKLNFIDANETFFAALISGAAVKLAFVAKAYANK